MGTTTTMRGATRGRRGKVRSVFVSAPAFVNSRGVRRVLEEEGAEVVAADERGGRTMADAVAGGLAAADLAVGIITNGSENGTVLFEIGMARGMRKPALLILAPDVSLPAEVAADDLPYLRARLDEPDKLRFGLRQFLAAAHREPPPNEPEPPETRPLGSRADELLLRLAAAPTAGEAELVDIVRDALEASGVGVLAARPPASTGSEPDLAAWSRDFDPWVGNPLVIEVKPLLRDRSHAEGAADQVGHYARAVQGRWGLLLYRESAVDVGHVLGRSHALVLALDEFLRALKTVSLGELVVGLRNRAVHGDR